MINTQPPIKRRDFLKTLGFGLSAAAFTGILNRCRPLTDSKPNIIYILADDLGYGELGSYGQKKIKTPCLDKLAAQGIKFSQHYSGSPVCAPSRCTLLTGKHTGHAFIRDNDEMRERGDVWNDPSIEGQRPLPAETVTLGTLLQNSGYSTCAVGKWGLGGPDSSGEPNRMGFDHWYGYLCQRQAHNYYPTHLWRNQGKHILEGNQYFSPHQKFPENADSADPANYSAYSGKQYAPDLMTEEALTFIRQQQDKPFFLYLAYPVPHVALQVPEDSLTEYACAFPETPYLGDKSYLPHQTPRAAYAAMISRMDRDIGRIMSCLQELGLDNNTIVFFSSDNGPTYAGGVDYEFFNSAGALRGLKGSLFEGGIRVPLIVHWQGRIKAGLKSNHISAFWDILPTICDIAGITPAPDTDGISFAPSLFADKTQPQHEYLYWEFRSYGGQQAVRMGKWKAIRTDLRKENTDTTIKLYDLQSDPEEQNNVAEEHPEVIEKIRTIFLSARIESERFPFPEIADRKI